MKGQQICRVGGLMESGEQKTDLASPRADGPRADCLTMVSSLVSIIFPVSRLQVSVSFLLLLLFVPHIMSSYLTRSR